MLTNLVVPLLTFANPLPGMISLHSQPSDIRNIGALAKSVEHCMNVVLMRSESEGEPFYMTAAFIRDRLRQVCEQVHH